MNFRGRSDNTWQTFGSGIAMADMSFTNSPGPSGKNTNANDTDGGLGYSSNDGSAHSSTFHDWYVALSSDQILLVVKPCMVYTSL